MRRGSSIGGLVGLALTLAVAVTIPAKSQFCGANGMMGPGMMAMCGPMTPWATGAPAMIVPGVMAPTVMGYGTMGGYGPMMFSRMGGPGMMMGAGMMGNMGRRMFYMHNGVPPGYRGRTNPLRATPEMVREGAALYGQQCAACHGPRGFGDGQAGRGLNPPPANLALTIRMPMASDEFLLWTISDGGAPFGTGMPAFKDVLSAGEIWRIVTFMRAGFPPLVDRRDEEPKPSPPPKQ
jgi:mono/diheme cytochrome c family protein